MKNGTQLVANVHVTYKGAGEEPDHTANEVWTIAPGVSTRGRLLRMPSGDVVDVKPEDGENCLPLRLARRLGLDQGIRVKFAVC